MRWILPIAAVPLMAFSPAPPSPTPFEPEVISGPEHEAALAFSPDGQNLYFQRSDGVHSSILASRRTRGGWSMPTVAEFSGRWSDMEPAFAADGSYIIFASSRPIVPDGEPIDGHFGGTVQKGGGGNLWRVDRQRDGRWGPAWRLPETVNAGTNVFAPALLGDGTLLFMRPDPETGRFRLYSSAAGANGYAAAEPLPFSTGAATDVDPVASRDGRFIIFGSGRAPARGIDLFMVRRTPDGWTVPQHLGSGVNTAGSDAEPRLSPDGTVLYYSSERMADGVKAEWNNGKYNIWTIRLADLPLPPNELR